MRSSIAIACLAASVSALKAADNLNDTSYITLSRQEKADQIWTSVTQNAKSMWWEHMSGMLVVDENPTFDTPGDTLQHQWNGYRNKTIHCVGAVAKLTWKSVGDHPYTGMFKGADTGFVRFSTAGPILTSSPLMIPGMGVKLLRDGIDSANFPAMYSVDGQDSLNFFANDFSNHIPKPTNPALKPLEARFATATDWIQTMGLSDFAQYTQEGTYEDNINFPYKLRFAPQPEWQFPATVEEGYTNYFDDLATIPAGSKIYDIYALSAPEELGGTEMLIGEFITASQITTSLWGDDHLFFRHQRMDDDLAIHPEWEPYVPIYEGFFSLEQEAQKPECPFKEILNYLQ